MPEKPKTLLFLTYQYPFLPGEYFIESEISYLSEAFSEVLVVPARCFWWRSEKPPRCLPENVALVDPGQLSWMQRVWFSLVGALDTLPMVVLGRKIWPGAPVGAVGWFDDLKSMYKSCVLTHMLRHLLKTRLSGSDVVAYAYWRDFSAAALAFLRKRGLVRRLFVRCHRVDIYHPKRWSVQSFIDSYADAIFPVSQDGVNHLVGEKGLDAGKIDVQRLGIRVPETQTRQSTDGVLRLVSCSNIVPVKRVDLIARVVASLPGRVEWTHIGDGPDKALVDQVVATLDSTHTVQFTGRLSNDAVYSYYSQNAVDWFVNLSESEGVPVSIMEAMAHGIPCIATDVGGTSEIVHQSNGILVSADIPVEEIVSLITQQSIPENLESLRSRARETAEEMCSAEVNYRRFCEMISQ